MATEWEYKDFVYDFPKGNRPSRFSISIVQTRHDIWMDIKSRIFTEIQKWLDNGWQPIGPIDESGLRWRSYKQLHVEPMSIALVILVVGILMVLYDLMNPQECEEVTEYRISMRRIKS